MKANRRWMRWILEASLEASLEAVQAPRRRPQDL